MRRSGFSLAELIMVMVIIAILSVLAAPRVAGALARQRADAAARRIVADVGLAQREARAASATRTVTFNVGRNRYAFTGLSNLSQTGTNYTVDLGDEPYVATLVSADFAGGTALSFDGFGKPMSGGTVVLRIGKGCRQITVNADSGAAAATEVTCPPARVIASPLEVVVETPTMPAPE